MVRVLGATELGAANHHPAATIANHMARQPDGPSGHDGRKHR